MAKCPPFTKEAQDSEIYYLFLQLMILPAIRRKGFWFWDSIRGSEVRRHLQAIQRINRDQESDFALGERKKYLSAILDHCKQTVPFYQDSGNSGPALPDFPVTNKNLIREHFDLFRSDAYPDARTYKATTSGSTGTPFTILHDAGKKKRHIADTLYFGDAVGHALGYRLYYLKIWNEGNQKSQWIRNLQNIVPVDVFQMTDERIAELLEALRKDASPKSLLGYASALDVIAAYIEKHPSAGPIPAIRSVTAMSEALAEPTKKALATYFRCPVVSRYGNLENGILAQQTRALPEQFLMNLASYEIEILELGRDVPVAEGEMGRIVVTDLFNRAMPLIRYDTGDIGCTGKIEAVGANQYVFKRIEGRKMDAVYNTKGELISSYLFANQMWKYKELDQFQFIQHAQKDYEFRLSSPKKFERERELLEEFRGFLGQDANIRVTYVDEIPLLSSGKRRKVVSKLPVK